MNKHLINEFSTIQGKLNSYTPTDIIFATDNNYTISNCIAVFSEPTGFLERKNFKVGYYKEFTKEDYKNTDRVNHTVYLIKSDEDNATSIIEDIKQGAYYQV